MSISTMMLLQKFRPALAEDAKRLRAEGASIDTIAAHLTAKSGVAVGRETLRIWFKRLDEASDD